MANLEQRQTNAKGIVLQDLLNFSESSDNESISQPVSPIGSHTHSSKNEALFTDGKGKENIQKKRSKLRKKSAEVDADGKALRTDAKAFVAKVMSENGQTEKKQSSRKTSSCAQSKSKASLDIQNMTLASLGISFDFSASSDEDENPRKEKIQLVYRNQDGRLPLSCQEKPGNKLRPDSPLKLRQNAVKDHGDAKLSTGLPSEPRETETVPTSVFSSAGTAQTTTNFGVNANQQSDSSKSTTVPSVKDKHVFRDSETVDTSSRTQECKKSGVKGLKLQPLPVMTNVLKSHGKTKPDFHQYRSDKDKIPLHHPNVSVIRSAHLTGSLIDISPSEESLLPLSESTRLDCSESNVSLNQNSDQSLARQNLPKRFDFSLAHGQDSSYEQLKIVVQKDKQVPPADSVTNNSEGDRKAGMGEEKQSASVTGLSEISENETQYVTCLATPDNSSMYEAVDASVQTSFQFEAMVNSGNEKKDTDQDDFQGTKAVEEHAEMIPELAHCDSLDKAVADEDSEDCSLVQRDQCNPADSDMTSLKVNCGSFESQGKRKEGILLVSTTGENTEKNHSKRGKVAKPCEKAAEMLPMSSHCPESGQKVLSESNISESSSDDDSAITKDHLKAENYQPLSSLSTELQCMNLSQEISVETPHLVAMEDESNNRKSRPLIGKCQSPESNQVKEAVSKSRGISAGHVDSSSEDDSDEKLEEFLCKMRTPARPTKDIREDDNMDDFIVNDSDVTDSDEEVCYADLTRHLDADDDLLLEPAEGKRSSRQKRRTGISRLIPAQELTSSEDETDENSTDCSSNDDNDDDNEGNVFVGLSTPQTKLRPTFSQSQTPLEASPKWYTPATSRKTKPKGGADFGDSKAITPFSKPREKTSNTNALPASASLTQSTNRSSVRPLGFLRSLSTETPDHLRDDEARGYVVHFKKRHEELSSRLFKLFNFTVFENQLPADMPVIWNKRLLKTAGLCKQKRVGTKYSAAIELSAKVCDTAERVRDTLVHEMCHAAVWVINRAKEGHGRYWRYWAGKANRAHPEIPVIRVCHDYSISTKYIYRCVQCGYQIGRHSKSLDTEKKCCGRCHGRFQLQALSTRNTPGSSVPATPRTPNPFAMFVKENYGSVKKQGGGLAHREVMEALSKEFAKTKISFS